MGIKSVIISERDSEKNVIREYSVPVRQVAKIPLSKDSIETVPEGQDPQFPEPE